MLSLLIKGTRQEAEAAAKQRNIEATWHQSLRNDQILYAEDTDYDKVVAWFIEPGGTPFPVGTLLLYNKVKESA